VFSLGESGYNCSFLLAIVFYYPNNFPNKPSSSLAWIMNVPAVLILKCMSTL